MTLYFIRAVTTDLIKIGKSDFFDQRLSKLRREGPDELIVLKVLNGDSDYISALEKELHLDLKDSNHHHEWFYPTQSVMAAMEYLV